jgi:hypothetical protein
VVVFVTPPLLLQSAKILVMIAAFFPSLTGINSERSFPYDPFIHQHNLRRFASGKALMAISLMKTVPYI